MKLDKAAYRILAWCMLIAILSMLPLDAWSQSGKKSGQQIRAGNKLYHEKDFEAAELKYNEALEEDPTSEVGLFNQGDAYYQQEKFEEALQNFELSAEMLEDPVQKAAAFHNLGNTYFKSQDLQKSIEAYKNALRHHPSDEETRYNLALAQSMLKEQEQQQQDQQDQQDQQEQQQDQQQGGNEDDQQQEQDGQENQQDQQQNEGEQEGQQDQQEDQQDQGQEERPAPQPSQLTKEEVQRILEALANDENKVQEKIIKAKTKTDKVKIEKDW